MRMKAEHVLPEPGGGSGFDAPHSAISVLHGEGEFALLQRGTHALHLGGRHAALKNQAFRAAADAAPQHGHKGLAGAGVAQTCGAQFCNAGRIHPQGTRLRDRGASQFRLDRHAAAL